MNNLYRYNSALGAFCYVLLMLLITCHVLSGQENDDYTLSPYFLVSCTDSTTDRLPLKETSATVNICGVIADVTVNQRYCNEGENVLEAIYVFPASTRAAVYSMKMSLGDRILLAKIEEKEKAREDYEQAIEDGHTASLLEQERANVFKMTVGNILPGDTIDIEMKYTELLIPVDGEYSFVYPTVVGPRYVSVSEDSASTNWTGSPWTPEGEQPLYDFSMQVKLNAGLQIGNIYCPSHDSVEIVTEGKSATCRLLSKKEGNRDFILTYILSGNQLETGLLLYEGENENFFLAMIQPPASPTDQDIPPREYVFIMDVSGSMHGFPIEISKALLTDLIRSLRPSDRFNIVFFAGGSAVLSENSLEATEENIQLAIDMLNSMEGSGGTELLNAMNRALNMQGTEDYSRSFVIATDGYVTVERQAFDLIRNNLGEANFFPFGIGSSANRYLIEGLAHVGNTEPIIVTKPDEAAFQAEKFREYIQYPVLTNIQADFEVFDVYDVEPLFIPDVLAERPIIIFGKYKGITNGTISVSGLTGQANYENKLNVADFNPSPDNEALKYLWARKRLQLLDNYAQISNSDVNLKNEIIALSLKYNVLSTFTAFIAIDSLIRNTGDSIVSVKQVLPLPEGMSDDGLEGGFLPVSADLSSELITIHNENALLCYPTAVTDELTIAFNLSDADVYADLKLVIFDLSGKAIYGQSINTFEEGINFVRLNLKKLSLNLEQGYYVINLEVNESFRASGRFLYLNQ